MRIITLGERFKYLKEMYENEYNRKISYPEFMECIFAKLEEELRGQTSDLNKFQDIKVKTINSKDFEYTYEK